MLKSKYFIISLFLGITLFFCCCNNELRKKEEQKNTSFSWDTIKLETNGHPLGLTNWPVVFTDNNCEIYVNYNNVSNCLNLYNIDKKQFVKRIVFFNSGPNLISGLSTYVIWDDKLVIKESDHIKFVSKAGVVEDKLTLKDIDSKLNESYCLSGGPGAKIVNFRHLSISASTQSIVLRLYNKENGYRNIYKEPIFVEYSLATSQATINNIVFPEDINMRYYGPLEYPNIVSKGDSIIYSFPYKAEIYVYNKNSQKTNKKSFVAKHIPPKSEGLDILDKGNPRALLSIIQGSVYHHIDYDIHRNLYYMAYSQAKEEGEPRKRHLIVFDKHLDKIGEIELPQGLSPRYAISKKGLLFRNVKEDSFDTLTLHVLNVEVEKK